MAWHGMTLQQPLEEYVQTCRCSYARLLSSYSDVRHLGTCMYAYPHVYGVRNLKKRWSNVVVCLHVCRPKVRSACVGWADAHQDGADYPVAREQPGMDDGTCLLGKGVCGCVCGRRDKSCIAVKLKFVLLHVSSILYQVQLVDRIVYLGCYTPVQMFLRTELFLLLLFPLRSVPSITQR